MKSTTGSGELAAVAPALDDPEASAEAASGNSERIPGARLINLVRRTLLDRNLGERYICDQIGITTVYWSSLTNGRRRIGGLGKEKLQKLANFLGIALIQVYLLADHLGPEDFVVQQSLAGELAQMLAHMRAHPKWQGLAPPDDQWAALPERVRLLIASLYEHVCHEAFLELSTLDVVRAK